MTISPVSPIHLGRLSIGAPFALAPMAGVTNPPFRQLCREFAKAALVRLGEGERLGSPPVGSNSDAGLGLYVAEMVMSRAVVERNPRAMRVLQGERAPGAPRELRSAQVYGVDPKTVGQAVGLIANEGLAEHVDLNFGCPVPKVTRKGGGGALPWKTDLFRAIVSEATRAAAASRTPVSVKLRIGIDESHSTFREAARISVGEGAAAVTLHARTVAQRYSGTAQWEAISELVALELGVPVFGNGDVFTADDALAMISQTGCDGVAIGRGALGRPWLFADLVAAFHGSPLRWRPGLTEVARIIVHHGQLLVEYFDDERRGVTDLRKHIAWYLRGFPIGGGARNAMMKVSSLSELENRLAELPNYQYPEVADEPRGRMGGAKPPHLPHGWLESRELTPDLAQALKLSELDDFTAGLAEISGG